MTYHDSSHIQPRTHWQDWINLALGIWLFLSPWALKFATATVVAGPLMAASWNAWILGIAVFVVSIVALYRIAVWPEWLNFALGVWIFIAPWALNFNAQGYALESWDHWATGALIGILALWRMASPDEMSSDRRPRQQS